MRKLFALVLICLLIIGSVGLVGCSGGSEESQEPGENQQQGDVQSKEKPYRVAMIMTGPINDAGWNASAHDGLMKAHNELGVEVAFTENVAAPDYETTIRDYGDQGFDLIIAHGFQLTDATKNVAPDYPDQMFMVVNGSAVQEPNMGAFRFDSAQTGFVAGTLAGLLTKSNTVGIMVADKAPNYQASMDGFEAAAKYVNPAVKVLTAYTDTSSDIQKGKEIGVAMAEQGADILACNANQVGLGSIEAAKEKGINAIGFISDQSAVAPETIYASAIQDVSKLVQSIIKVGLEGELKPEVRLNGVNEGVIGPSPWHGHEANISQEVKDKLAEVLEGLADGSLREQGILPKPQY
jgi:basic membrane protein A